MQPMLTASVTQSFLKLAMVNKLLLKTITDVPYIYYMKANLLVPSIVTFQDSFLVVWMDIKKMA